MLPGEVQMIEPVDESVFVIKQVRKQDDETPAIQARGKFIHDAADVGTRPILGAEKHLCDIGDY